MEKISRALETAQNAYEKAEIQIRGGEHWQLYQKSRQLHVPNHNGYKTTNKPKKQ